MAPKMLLYAMFQDHPDGNVEQKRERKKEENEQEKKEEEKKQTIHIKHHQCRYQVR